MTIYSVATFPTMTSNQINDWLKRAGSRSRKTQWKKNDIFNDIKLQMQRTGKKTLAGCELPHSVSLMVYCSYFCIVEK